MSTGTYTLLAVLGALNLVCAGWDLHTHSYAMAVINFGVFLYATPFSVNVRS